MFLVNVSEGGDKVSVSLFPVPGFSVMVEVASGEAEEMSAELRHAAAAVDGAELQPPEPVIRDGMWSEGLPPYHDRVALVRCTFVGLEEPMDYALCAWDSTAGCFKVRWCITGAEERYRDPGWSHASGLPWPDDYEWLYPGVA